MIQIARRLGLPSKLTGSGGAVVGICDDDLFTRLQAAYAHRGYPCLRVEVADKSWGSKLPPALATRQSPRAAGCPRTEPVCRSPLHA